MELTIWQWLLISYALGTAATLFIMLSLVGNRLDSANRDHKAATTIALVITVAVWPIFFGIILIKAMFKKRIVS